MNGAFEFSFLHGIQIWKIDSHIAVWDMLSDPTRRREISSADRAILKSEFDHLVKVNSTIESNYEGMESGAPL
jgi:hypothetical protein